MQKPDYKNWVPKSMVLGLGAATAASAGLAVLFGATDRVLTESGSWQRPSSTARRTM